MPIVAILGDDSNAVVQGVQLRLFALASGTGVGRVFAHGQPDPSAIFTPFQVIRAFSVSFLAAVDGDQIRLNSAIRRQDHWAVPQALAGLDALSEIYFLALGVGQRRQPPIQLGISIGITSLQILDNKSNGGESGIRIR